MAATARFTTRGRFACFGNKNDGEPVSPTKRHSAPGDRHSVFMQQAASFHSTAAGMFCRNRKITRDRHVSTALLANPRHLRTLDVALAEGFSIRLLSARAALYARPRPKMAREARAQRWLRELDRCECHPRASRETAWRLPHRIIRSSDRQGKELRPRALREPSAGLVAAQPFRAEEHARDGVGGYSSSVSSSCWPHSSGIPDHDHLLLQRTQ
jgi:hypothetical protein